MRYLPCWKQIGISQDRYTELLHFCRQYPEWKAEANSLLGIRAIKMDGLPHGSGKSDPTSAAAMQRERLLAKIQVAFDATGHRRFTSAAARTILIPSGIR